MGRKGYSPPAHPKNLKNEQEEVKMGMKNAWAKFRPAGHNFLFII